ncbi:MAG: hypothetical protein AAF533_26790 [Acidobacteriota bacterium]
MIATLRLHGWSSRDLREHARLWYFEPAAHAVLAAEPKLQCCWLVVRRETEADGRPRVPHRLVPSTGTEWPPPDGGAHDTIVRRTHFAQFGAEDVDLDSRRGAVVAFSSTCPEPDATTPRDDLAGWTPVARVERTPAWTPGLAHEPRSRVLASLRHPDLEDAWSLVDELPPVRQDLLSSRLTPEQRQELRQLNELHVREVLAVEPLLALVRRHLDGETIDEKELAPVRRVAELLDARR